MPKDTKTYTLFVAAPSDITSEKDIIRKLSVEWNRYQGEPINTRIEIQDWESHSFPLYGKRGQAIINEQVFDHCDFVIGLFWTKFGSPTGMADSGTEEEILRAIEQEKPLMLYFSDKPANPSSLNHEQHAKVIAFQKKVQSNSLYAVYDSDKAFEEKFRGDLSRIMTSILLAKGTDQSGSKKSIKEEKDETGNRYEDPKIIQNLIEKNFKVYWAKLYGIIEPGENVLPNGIKISKENQNKTEVQALKKKITEWEERILEYSTDLQAVLSHMNEYDDDEFKNEIFAEELWTVKGALKNPERELDRYRESFEKIEAHKIIETVSRIIHICHEYAANPPKPIKLNNIKTPEDFGLSVLAEPPTLLTGVVGKGIRSEIMHKLYPDLFTLMTRRSIWGLYFLTDERDEFVVDDTYKDIFRTVHNWDYMYDRFAYYNYIIYKQIEKYLAKHKIKLNEKYKYGYVNLFLVDIGNAHSADIDKLKRPRKI